MPRLHLAAVAITVALLAPVGAVRTWAQTPTPCAADAATARLEQDLFKIINNARAAAGVPALQWSSVAASAARCHSREMAAQNALAHVSTRGANPGDRLQQAGLAWSNVAENVAESPSIASAQRLMMDEPRGQPNHRANILNPALTRLGVGIARRGGMLFITEDFYTPLHD